MSNAFKAAMQAGTPQIGLWLTLANPYCAEVCASSGFQWLLIDGEHSPNDVRSILAQLQAVHGYPAHPIVRVVEGQTALIKQVLDIGATTLLVPMIDTAEQARAMVAATRYPPEGIRGVGVAGARAARWGARTDYVSVANGEICLLVQAETATAMANLEAICAVDGVDGVFIGPADLSASLGHLGNAGHPDVQAVIERGIQTIRGCGKAAGILTSDAAQARHYLELGATFVAVGLDVVLFARATRQLANDFGVGLAALPSAEQQRRSGPY